MTRTDSAELTSLRPIATTVYLPAGIYGIGQGAAAPVIALVARDLGASVPVAGLMVALWGLGQVVGDLPAGGFVARFGERVAIIVASLTGTIGVLLAILASNLAVLATGLVLTGLANAVWGLARMSYLSEAVPFRLRAQAMSLFGGAMRFGYFVGPLIGAGVILLVGTRGGFFVQLTAVVLAGLLMARLPNPPSRNRVEKSNAGRLVPVVTRHRRLLATLGAGSLLMGAARASRDAVFPLWGDHIGLDAATVSVVFGIGALIDVVCSYPAGYLMDRYGRSIIAVPSLLTMGLAYLGLPLTQTIVGFTVVAIVLGFGNGFGNGVIMTIGADTAPADTRAEFLAAWRLTHDLGFLIGPLSIAGAAAIAPLAAAPLTMAAISVVGAGLMARFIPRYTSRQNLRTERPTELGSSVDVPTVRPIELD